MPASRGFDLHQTHVAAGRRPHTGSRTPLLESRERRAMLILILSGATPDGRRVEIRRRD